MPAAGLEPARGCPQQILSLPRLPFRHTGRFSNRFLSYHGFMINASFFFKIFHFYFLKKLFFSIKDSFHSIPIISFQSQSNQMLQNNLPAFLPFGLVVLLRSLSKEVLLTLTFHCSYNPSKIHVRLYHE